LDLGVSFHVTKAFFLKGLPTSKKSIDCVMGNGSIAEWSHEIPTCEDVDECTVGGSDPCLKGASFAYKKCKNLPGSYVCQCREGFEALPNTPDKCSTGKNLQGTIKFDEKFPADLVNPNSALTSQLTQSLTSSMSSMFGSFMPGRQFRLQITGFSAGSIVVNYKLFIFEDDATDSPDSDVDIESMAKRMGQEWKAENISGLQLTPIREAFALADVDECLDADANDCSENAHCVNTVGSYECSCKDGFIDDGRDELAGRSCAIESQRNRDDVSETRLKESDGGKWQVIAYVMTALLVVGLPLSFFVVRKKYAQVNSKVIPAPEMEPRSPYVVFPETMVPAGRGAHESYLHNKRKSQPNANAKKYSA